MPNAANSASETPTARPKDAPEAPSTPPRRRKAPRAFECSSPSPRSTQSPPPLLPHLARACGRSHPKPLGHRQPKRRSSADPGNRAEASPGDASGSASAGARSPAPPELRSRLSRRLAGLPGEPPHGPPQRLVEPPQGMPGRGAPPGPSETKRRARRSGSNPLPGRPPGPSRRASAPALPPAPRRRREPQTGRRRTTRPGARSSRRRTGRRRWPEPGPGTNPPALRPSAVRLSGRLAALAETAKAYARAAQSDNTQRAYAADWRQFASWLRRQGLSGDAARSGSRRPLPRVASRARRRGAFGRDRRATAVRDRLALPAARRTIGHP